MNDRLWKAARTIHASDQPGADRLKMILNYAKKPLGTSDPLTKFPRETDMVNRVASVFAVVGSKCSLGLFDNVFMRDYLDGLETKHTPPHRLERLRILEVAIDGAFLEFARIVKVSSYQYAGFPPFHIMFSHKHLVNIVFLN